MSARIALALSLLVATAAHANVPTDYAYAFPIETAAQDGSSAWHIDLTPAVYAWVQDAALRDIEVFNAAGQPVPFARSANQPATLREQATRLPALALPPATSSASASDLRLVIDRDADGRLRRIDAGEQAAPAANAGTRDWLLDASGVAPAIDRLVLAWRAPATGVVARFAVEASDDLQAWRAVGSGTVLALEHGGAHLERHDITLGDVRANYLRLHRLDDGAALEGLVAQAHSLARESAAPAGVWLDAAAGVRDAGAPASVAARFDYTLPAALPFDSARIELANDNALAPLALSARARGEAWTELAAVTAFRLRTGEEAIRNGDIEWPGGTRLREFRIDARVPLGAAPRLGLRYRPDRFVFLAEGAGPYTLAVGSARAHRAEYPLEVALASLRARLGTDWQPPAAHLGVARESGGVQALQAVGIATPAPWRRWLLWGVLVAAAAVVGGFALSLLRTSGKRDA